MTDPIIRVENLSKLYYIGGRKPKGPGLQVRLRGMARASRHYLRTVRRTGILTQVRQAMATSKQYVRHIKQIGPREYIPELLGSSHRNGKLIEDNSPLIAPVGAFWVLKNVSFEVGHGEVLGVIGRNGAGKSTLLKILSRITEPTTGQAIINGRIGSLLEVGTGFHDELSGRENIYLNGTILGMKKFEIDRQLDEIIAFSGVERFISTPVKFYSSGMRIRLAFSVAAHLNTEILLIDEVLAVGDVAFQEKCLKKMGNLTQDEGRTVLFVSHNMSAIASLCPRSVLLDAGQVVAVGESSEIITQYYSSVQTIEGKTSLEARNDRNGSGTLRFTNFYLEDLEGNRCASARAGGPMRIIIEYTYRLSEQPKDVWAHIVFSNSRGQRLFACTSDVTGDQLTNLSPTGRFICTIPNLPLIPGNYDIQLSCLINRELADKVRDAGSISVVEGDFFGTGRLPISHYGDLMVRHYWSTEPSSSLVTR